MMLHLQLAEHCGTSSSSSATAAAMTSTAVDRKRVRHTHDEHGRAVKKQRPTVSFNEQQLSATSTAIAQPATAAAAAAFNTSQYSSNSVMNMSCDSSDSIQTVFKQSFYDTDECNADSNAAVAAATAAMQADHTEIETALKSQVQDLTAKVHQLEDQVSYNCRCNCQCIINYIRTSFHSYVTAIILVYSALAYTVYSLCVGTVYAVVTHM
jgi:hypothetical protein